MNVEKTMFDAEKSQSEFKKGNMDCKTTRTHKKGKVVSKETSNESIETKTEAVKAIYRKVGRARPKYQLSSDIHSIPRRTMIFF